LNTVFCVFCFTGMLNILDTVTRVCWWDFVNNTINNHDSRPTSMEKTYHTKVSNST
jgi:hypothetical protein